MAFSRSDKIRRNVGSKSKQITVSTFEEYCAVIASNKRRLNPTQREYVLSEDRITDFSGPVGSAKTTSALTRLIARATLMPGSNWGVFRATFGSIMAPGGVWQKFMDCCERAGPIILDKKGDGPIELWMATTDPVTGKPGIPAMWYFHGLDELTKLGSTEFTGILVSEANEIDELMAGKLNERLRHKRPPPYEDPEEQPTGPFYLEFEHNPTDEMHWLHRRFCFESACVHQDNCMKPAWGRLFRPVRGENEPNLPKGYYDEISKGYTHEQMVRFVEGLCGADPSGEGVFKDVFNESMHVGNLQLVPGGYMVRGWDFGRRRPAVVFRQITPEGFYNNLYAHLGENQNLESFIQTVKLISATRFPTVKSYVDYVDPHGNAKRDVSDLSSHDIMRRAGLNPLFRDVLVERGIELMEKNLNTLIHGRPRKMFDKNGCAYLISGYAGGYKYKDRQGGPGEKKLEPKKDGYYEHGMDADRYIDVNLEMGSTNYGTFKSNLRHTAPRRGY